MADQSGGSATSFRTAGTAYRLASALQPPTTDAAGPAAAGCRQGVSATSVGPRGISPAQPDSSSSASISRRRLVFELASADGPHAASTGWRHRDGRRVSAGVLVRRPLVALALVPKPLVLFLAGAVAGAIGKTVTAPLDRVKILLQVAIASETLRCRPPRPAQTLHHIRSDATPPLDALHKLLLTPDPYVKSLAFTLILYPCSSPASWMLLGLIFSAVHDLAEQDALPTIKLVRMAISAHGCSDGCTFAPIAA